MQHSVQIFYRFLRPVTKSFLDSHCATVAIFGNQSGFCAGVNMFHFPTLTTSLLPPIHLTRMPFLEARRVKDSLGEFESNTYERLRDGQVKLGSARYEDYAGSQRRMVKQMRTITVSCHTRFNVLGGRSEHLWVCPVCKNDNVSTNH
jgi:hypothetical protein